jgi:dihydroorotate dehydrogenase electron transfer subunit
MASNRDVALVERRPLEGAYALLTFRHPEVAREARAGQFVMIKAGRSADPPLRRPFSVMRVEPEREAFTLFVKAVGTGSRALVGLDDGGIAGCLGPLGRHFSPPAAGVEALLVAGGYGIAPFVLFCDEIVPRGLRARVFYGGRTAADLVLRSPFEALGVPLALATEDGSLGQRARVTQPLEVYLAAANGPVRLYACGPESMLHAVARVAERHGVPAEVSLDPWMGCGIGTCLGCVVRIQDAAEARPKYRCACTEGPVYDASVVVWPGESSSLARRRSLEAPV